MSHLGTYQRYVRKVANSSPAAGAAIPELTNISIPGANGVRTYGCEVTITSGKALTLYQVRLGPLGTALDPVVATIGADNLNVNLFGTRSSGYFQIGQPAATDKLTVSVFTWAGAINNTITGSAFFGHLSCLWVGEYLYRRQLAY